LVGERRNRRHPNDDEAAPDSRVTGVARRGQVAISLDELRTVLGFQRMADCLDWVCGIGHELCRNTPIKTRRVLEARPDFPTS